VLLKFVVDREVTSIQFLGDLKLVIDWTNGVNKIENLILNPIMEKITEVRSRFEDISFQHVFRELNKTADKLSKEALILQGGKLVTVGTN
jgi:ribonuclease HI